MSFALLFPGQGGQHLAMLPRLIDDTRVQEACARRDVDEWRARLIDAD
jgi:[acyl-carrier-protein] S-malonyltransferase